MVKMAPIASAPHVSTVPSRGFGGVGTKPCTFGEVARHTSKGPARARTLATILVLIAVLGGIAGILSNTVGLSPAVMWAVLMPNLFLVSRLLFTKRRTAPPANPSMSEQVLLDASNTGGRVIQSLLPLVGIVLGVIGVTMLFRAGGGVGVASVAMTVAGVVLIGLPLRHVIGWDVSYRGHRIRFENDACFGERLLIDGQLVDRGGVGLRMVLSGTIAGGDGAGDIIRATSFAGLPTFHCRIVAASTTGSLNARMASSGQP
jgi:hypothetical protein